MMNACNNMVDCAQWLQRILSIILGFCEACLKNVIGKRMEEMNGLLVLCEVLTLDFMYNFVEVSYVSSLYTECN